MARKLVEKPFCGGTMSSSAFFGMLRSGLRRMSIFWKPKNEALKNIRRAIVGGGRSKWEYPCGNCGEWFIKAHVQLDHIEPCGTLLSFEDIGPFVKRLFCEKEGYMVLCKECHRVKTNLEQKEEVK